MWLLYIVVGTLVNNNLCSPIRSLIEEVGGCEVEVEDENKQVHISKNNEQVSCQS